MTLQVLEELSNLSTGYSDTLSGNNLIVERLQNIVKDMRLVPISTVFSFFPRAVRDMEKELKKEIDLIIEGEESRLDKTLVDQLKSPLLHLIRNAVDHGIESPDIRLEHDKSSQGQLVLAAKEQADKIIISVQDDGSGIDPDKLKETAIEKGIINKNLPYKILANGSIEESLNVSANMFSKTAIEKIEKAGGSVIFI